MRRAARSCAPVMTPAPVTVELDPRAMQTCNVADHAWIPADGPFELCVGTSSVDIAVRLAVADQ